MNFSFGSNTAKTTAVVGSTITPATTATGFSLGTPAASTGLTFGTTPTSVPGFSLGGSGDSKPAAQTAAVKPIASSAPLTSTFSVGTTPSTTTASLGFASFSSTPTTSTVAPQVTTPGFSFGASTPTAVATTTSAPITFSLAPVTTSSLKLGVTTAPTLGQTLTSLTTVGTTTTTTSTTPATLPTNSISFVQLEDFITKWTHELEEQEKIFNGQAVQINNWDALLNSNSEKIVALNNDVAEMKLKQQQLDHELNFIFTQQRELEEVLVPLEKQASEIPSNTDPEREHTYHMSETLDTQLKQMSEDLKEIIEHLNESSRTQDNSDPIVQIGRILDAHMNSLQWIDQMTMNIQNELENVTKLHDIHRRENERSFRILYE